MQVSILCSDEKHPVNAYLSGWILRNKEAHNIEMVRKRQELSGGDILFLISCSEIIKSEDRSRYGVTLVLHASDLPRGRGWSPHIWQIISGTEVITMSLIEADDFVDRGRVWKKIQLDIPRHALWDEINNTLFLAEVELMDFAIQHSSEIIPSPQDSLIEPTYYDRRTASDSEVDPFRSIAEQFDLIRVCDPVRFPAFFCLHGKKYRLVLEKIDD